MSLEQWSDVLLWCAAISYLVLLVWFGTWVVARNAIHRLHSRWFHLERTSYDAMTWLLIGVYKLLVLLFFVIPWIALRVVTDTGGATP
jgi:hypothetical protein